MLRRPQELSGAANPEVLFRQLLSALDPPEDVEPLPRRLSRLLADEEHATPRPLGPSDPPPKLMELGEPEALRMLDDDERGVRNVEPHLHHRGGDQDARLPGAESLDRA